MRQKKRLLFEVDALKKTYGDNQALNIKRLEIHPGTIYGFTGSFGAGKTTLLNILSGVEKQTSGNVLYDDLPHETNWLGKITPNEDIFYTKNLSENSTVIDIINTKFGKKKNIIKNRYFTVSSLKHILKRKLKDISAAEKNWFGMILAIEKDPRILLVDDYGIYFDTKLELDFRNQIIKMNRNLGTTVILSSPSDIHLKSFASVLIYLDHGNISKIRTGFSKKPMRRNKQRNNYRSNNNKSNKSNKKP
jgi:ABC-type multidrug transport system ATPase subunit